LTLQGPELIPVDSRVALASSIVFVGYGEVGAWKEDPELENLFPFWRRDLWSK
jgi:hypothetical protein